MKNKLKIAAVVIIVIAGMVFYKENHDRNERAKTEKESKTKRSAARADKHRWN